MGSKVDSSLTRVAPFFLWLTRGKGLPPLEWIPEMIRTGDKGRSLAGTLAQVIENDLRSSPGSVEIVLEKNLPPREVFLRWLIDNPEKLNWDNMESSISEKDADTPGKKLNKLSRRKLHKAGKERKETIEEAKKLLDSAGAEGSQFKWWAFEGFTSVDCTIRTENALILVEGKRTESVSKKVSWYEGRNQIVRNIEAAYQWANKTLPQESRHNFGVLVVTEEDNPQEDLSENIFELSLPHITDPKDRERLASHYLGQATWENLCPKVGLDFDELPDTVDEALKILDFGTRKQSNIILSALRCRNL